MDIRADSPIEGWHFAISLESVDIGQKLTSNLLCCNRRQVICSQSHKPLIKNATVMTLKNMLGEQVAEEKGKIISQRVLGVEPPKMEISFSGTGKYSGTDTTVTVTYWSSLGPDGALHGEGQGLVMSRDGQEMATFTGQGVGRFVGSVFYNTVSTGRLAFLKNLVAAFEHDVDESGNVSNKFWEWK